MTALDVLAGLGDQVRAEARQVDPVKVLFTLAMLPFVTVGWLVGFTLRAVWAVAVFGAVAFLVGYRRASGPTLDQVGERLRRPPQNGGAP